MFFAILFVRNYKSFNKIFYSQQYQMQPTNDIKKRPKIEVYSVIFMGHLLPMLKTIQILQNKNPDLDISLVTGAYVKSKFQSTYPKINMVEVEDGIDENMQKNIPGKQHGDINLFIVGYMQKYFQQKNDKPDLIIADLFMLQAFKYANNNGVKFIANQPTSYFGLSHSYNVLSLNRSIRVQGYTILYSLPDKKSSLVEQIFKVYRNRGILIFNSFIGLDDPTIIPSNYTLVGLLPNSIGKHQQLDISLTEWMSGWRQKGKNQFFYISFGSMIRLSEAFIKKLVRVIQKLQYPTIWALRSPFAHVIESQLIYHREWLPQQLILQQEDVRGYLTHGGWGSISEAVATSTPMVCIPVFADQGQNAKIIQNRCIGISLSQFFQNKHPQFLDVPVQQQVVAKAIRDIMEDPSYFQSMKRMNRLSKTHDAAEQISKIVYRLLQFGYEYLISPAYQNATIKDNSVPLKDILVQKYWPLLEKKP